MSLAADVYTHIDIVETPFSGKKIYVTKGIIRLQRHTRGRAETSELGWGSLRPLVGQPSLSKEGSDV
jgi:hypothetical protein